MKSPLIIALALLVISWDASTCDKTDLRDFGAFYGQLGKSTATSGQSITISTSFLDQLANNPTGAEMEKNRNELLYLLSANDERAVRAGLATLVHLLKHPSFTMECDSQHEMYGKEELAFALSRTEQLGDQLCVLAPADRDMAVNFYAAHNELYGNFDPPWISGNLTCK